MLYFPNLCVDALDDMFPIVAVQNLIVQLKGDFVGFCGDRLAQRYTMLTTSNFNCRLDFSMFIDSIFLCHTMFSFKSSILREKRHAQ